MKNKLNNYLIAVDLDGTLITGFDNYDKLSFQLLKELASSNYVVIATGRPYRSSIYYYNLLNLNTPIINYNGSLIQNPNDKNFKKISISIPKDDVLKILTDNIDVIDNIFCEVEDTIYLYKDDNKIKDYLHSDGSIIHIGNLASKLESDPNGAIIFAKKNSENRLSSYMKEKFNDKLLIRFWDNEDLVIGEVYSPLTSKGYAIDIVREYYNIPFEKTISFGDGHNDIEMFQKTKYSVLMENSHKELAQYSTHKTKSVIDSGVYHFLKNF